MASNWVKKSNIIRFKYTDFLDCLLKLISHTLDEHSIHGTFFGGIVRDYFTMNNIPNDIDLAVDNVNRFVDHLKDNVGKFIFKFKCESLDEYKNECNDDRSQQSKRIILESPFKIGEDRMTFIIDVVSIDFLLNSCSDFDINCLLYLPTNSFGIFHLKTNEIINVMDNIRNKKFRFVNNFLKLDRPFITDSIHPFLVDLKLIYRYYKLIDNGWVCSDNTSFFDSLPFKISLKDDAPHCSVCLSDMKKIHHIKCYYCENYLCTKCSFFYAKKYFSDSNKSEPTCYLCKRDFFNLSNLGTFNPPIFFDDKKKDVSKNLFTTII